MRRAVKAARKITLNNFLGMILPYDYGCHAGRELGPAKNRGNSNLFIVRIGDMRFEIPEAVISGG